jgi:hypothetical protein
MLHGLEKKSTSFSRYPTPSHIFSEPNCILLNCCIGQDQSPDFVSVAVNLCPVFSQFAYLTITEPSNPGSETKVLEVLP